MMMTDINYWMHTSDKINYQYSNNTNIEGEEQYEIDEETKPDN